MRSGGDRMRLRHLAKHHGAAFAGELGGEHHLAVFARDLRSRHFAAGDFALLRPDRHRSAADGFPPARLQIAEHDPVMGAETNDLARLDIIHERNARHAALDLLDHSGGRLRRSRQNECAGGLQHNAEMAFIGFAPRPSSPGEIQYGVLVISPEPATYQCSLTNGLPASRSASQSASRIGGNGPKLAAGTLPTEWRDSW